MDQQTLKTLEYDKIVGMLQDHASSSLAKDIIKDLRPSSNIKKIQEDLDKTSEAMKLLSLGSNPPLAGISSTKDQLKRLEIGGSLSAGSILQIGQVLRCARLLKDYLEKIKKEEAQDEDFTYLDEIISSLFTYKGGEDKIFRAIISEEEISDDASARLKSIRRKIADKNSSIRDRLNSIIRSQKNEKYLQDQIYSLRDGRFVIPVKVGSQSQIPGIVHDTSQSGQTVFIEPMAVVNLNNEIRNLEIEEKEEIDRILLVLSDILRDKTDQIRSNEGKLVEIDFIFAKAKFARKTKSTMPILNDQGISHINKGRHPLLGDEEVVPVDIYIGKDFDTLVVTGPNTGGKTVSLKLLGLLNLMAQSGLFIPAGAYSQIGVFDSIYADIGDEQSIEQSLSTFSSHMVNIVDILSKIKDNSLVLFDELGAGTDPTEGSALAISILNYLRKIDVKTVATTHYNELKLYALTEDRVENASMEFDLKTLSPTYRLLIGVPGKSNAFEISKRLGLDESIIEEARQMIGKDQLSFEDIVGQMDKDREILEEERLKAQQATSKIKRLEAQAQSHKDKTESMREKILEEARIQARDIIREAKEESKLVIDEIRQISSARKDGTARQIYEAQDILRQSEKDLSEGIDDRILDIKTQQKSEDLKVGDTVRIPSLDQTGTVVSKEDKSGQVQVQVGILKMNLDVSSLVKDNNKEKEENVLRAKTFQNQRKRDISPSIDLRGVNVEDAIARLDKYLDDAFISGLKQVEIIHGKGTGALRKGLKPYFKNHRHIKNYRLGEFEEGGSGVTIVELK